MELGVNETNPYLQGPYAPVTDEVEATDLPVTGEVPKDLWGAYFRNGPNPRFAPKGGYHWFDGDGMVHGVHIENGRVRYLNRYVGTPGLAADIDAGQARWGGIMEPTTDNPDGRFYKDTGNTDIVFHNKALLATWYLCGEMFQLDPQTLATTGTLALPASGPRKVSAHPTIDPRTQELMFFDYGRKAPYLTYGVIGADGTVKHHVPIDIPGPRLPHTMAITENYSILMDLPVFLRPEARKLSRWIVGFHKELPARFGLIPRFGTNDDVKWFEAEPCYVYHVVNCWEEGNEVVMVGCRVDDPTPHGDPEDGKWSHLIANLQVKARLHRWRFNLETGECSQEYLDDEITEFPTINAAHTGVRSRYGYNAHLDIKRTLLFDGITKYDTDTGTSQTMQYGEGRVGSEAGFAAREGATAEDDGYLVTFVSDRGSENSELWIVPAQDVTAGPVARVQLPQRVPLGFHACWVDGAELTA